MLFTLPPCKGAGEPGGEEDQEKREPGPGSSAQSKSPEHHPQPRIAGPAIPAQVQPVGVLLVAVQVAYLNVPGGATEGTDPGFRRSAPRRVGPVAQGAVSDLRFLPQGVAAGRA